MSTLSIGIAGVGRMGAPIARALAAAGHSVTVFDTDPSRMDALEGDGIPVANSAAELAATSDILFTVLPGAAEFEAAAPELVSALRPGSLWIDLTTSDPRAARLIASFAEARGVSFVGAPMGGGAAAAADGRVSFVVGGVVAAVERARPILESLGTIDHLGTDPGSGYVAKLLANLLWFGQVVAVTEALLLGQAQGIAPARLAETLRSGPGGSAFMDVHLAHLLDGDYLAAFGIDRVVEELDLLASLAREGEIPFELSATITRLHREALERFGAIDGELLAAKLLEERAGRTLRR